MAQAAFIMFLAGVGIPILAALNAALGQRIASPVLAACILFLVALLITTLLALLIAGRQVAPAVQSLGSVPVHLFGGGVFVAFYVLSVTFLAPRIGVGNAIFFVLLGQLCGASVIDHFGLFGARIAPFDLRRAAGIALMLAGVWLARRMS